jgi:hypothetical protein
MKYDEYKKLEESINNQNFNKNYKTINIVLKILSYFGHITCIFLAYFMLSKVIEGVMTGNIIIAGISSVILLSGLEILKRNMFDRFSISYLKLKGITKEVLPLFFISLTIISLSFYASIKGAAEFSSKSKEIEIKGKETIKIYNDSLTKVYTDEIKGLEDSFKSKDETLTNLQNLALTQRLSKDQRNTISDLSNQKKDIQNQVSDKKNELSSKIKEHEKEVITEAEGQKEDNNTNSILFIIISTIIELTILAGVFFNQYYKFRSYNEFRIKLEKDPEYQKWLLYDQILNIIYTEDTKMSQKLPSNKAIIDMCKANGILVLNKELSDFLKIVTNIGIIKVSGSAKYINKTKDLAEEYLRKQYNIK